MFGESPKHVAALILLSALIILGGSRGSKMKANEDTKETSATPAVSASGPWDTFEKPSEDVLRQNLDDLQYRVTQMNGTESPFRNTYWNNHEDGIYVDVVSGEPLFSSHDKFDSGTGWPCFAQPLVSKYVKEFEDKSLGMNRVEVRSSMADSHLGHVFSDGPRPTGLRYCINSASLRFIPKEELEKEGYKEYLRLFEQNH